MVKSEFDTYPFKDEKEKKEFVATIIPGFCVKCRGTENIDKKLGCLKCKGVK